MRYARQIDLPVLRPEHLDDELATEIIAAIYNRALEDYKMAFLKLRSLEKEKGQEAEIQKYIQMKEEAETFMLTGGDYAIDQDTVKKIRRCFEAFQHMVENM